MSQVDDRWARVNFLAEVGEELRAARAKHPDEEGVLTDAEWLAVLTEEVGECARAIQDESDEHLRAELVQVAAMAMRWALAIPQGRVRPPWAQRAEGLPSEVEDLARALAASHSLPMSEAVERITRYTEQRSGVKVAASTPGYGDFVRCTRDGATCEREPCCRRPRT